MTFPISVTCTYRKSTSTNRATFSSSNYVMLWCLLCIEFCLMFDNHSWNLNYEKLLSAPLGHTEALLRQMLAIVSEASRYLRLFLTSCKPFWAMLSRAMAASTDFLSIVDVSSLSTVYAERPFWILRRLSFKPYIGETEIHACHFQKLHDLVVILESWRQRIARKGIERENLHPGVRRGREEPEVQTSISKR